ncbi:FMN-dependent NADH-azoreductase [Streptomyces noursei]|uniref:FMN-dependent NADH-azoreductase n=1 Tax=Streptomyces noursei TaxID=1971 RepID=UPI00167582DC|nr:NAD(P)H-dependent oxidoreductase [Streptomyces noursei]MCZ1016853.1 NAD(P)H-dependent oxidoreductase [Streptomyces noursei]GGX06641.1 FMN-dependent NADH-azoreductase [Streptomyces noursei]
MATLLLIDSSVFPEGGSASRAVTAAFRKTWEEQHPDGTVIHRDLAADPLPHLDAVAASAGFSDPATHTPEQQAAFALRTQLAEELEQADAIVIGAPMYNFTIPSTLKAWLDQAIIMGRTAGENASAKGKPVVVVASRGGSYAPGTPREPFEYVQNYLEAVLNGGFGLEVEFIVPELTMAPSNPAMAELVPLFETSRSKAHEQAKAKAKELVARFAA